MWFVYSFFSSSQISLKKHSPGPPPSNLTRSNLHRLPLFFHPEHCYGILFNLFNLTTYNAIDVMPAYPLIQDGVRAFAPFFSPATAAPLELNPILSLSRGICKCLQEASVTLFFEFKSARERQGEGSVAVSLTRHGVYRGMSPGPMTIQNVRERRPMIKHPNQRGNLHAHLACNEEKKLTQPKKQTNKQTATSSLLLRDPPTPERAA